MSFFRLQIALIGVLMLVSFTTIISKVDVNPEEFVSAYNKQKEHFQKKAIQDDFSYEIKYVPNELRLIHLKKKNIMKDEELESFLNENRNNFEFQLEISVNDFNGAFLDYVSDSSDYDSRLQYYAFDFQRDITLLIDGKKEVPCTDFVFERTFGLNNKVHFSLGFVVESYHTLEIVIENKHARSDAVRFNFDKKNIGKLPKLKKIKKWKK